MKITSNTTLRLFTYLAAITWSLSLYAQMGPIKNIRFNDDFSYLQNDSVEKKGTDKLKYMSISKRKGIYVSVGGELREWVELRQNPNFGDLPPGFKNDDNGSLLHRAMVHTDLQLGTRWSVFGQLNNTFEFGNPNPSLPEISVDTLDLHQLSLAYEFQTAKGQHQFRLGRQELSLGNELLISTREGPNNRQPFDGLSYRLTRKKWKGTYFMLTSVIINAGMFDNTHVNEWLWGGYHEISLKKGNTLDAYYVGLYSERRAYQYQEGTQHRHTFGTRLWNQQNKLVYDIEAMYQTGMFSNKWINAINLNVDGRYVFKQTKLKPMVGLGLSYISGDYSKNDNQLNTFDALFPKPVYGLATPQGSSNIAHIKPTVGIAPLKSLFVNFSWYYLARTSVNDGTYTPSMQQVRPLPDITSDKYGVGTQYSLDAFYFLNSNWTIITFISYMKPAAYIKETGVGLPTFFAASTVQWKF